MAHNRLESFFSLNTLLYAIALVIAVSLSLNTVSVIERNYTLEQEVESLQEEISILSLENENLKFNIEYYKTDDYLEVAAKEKFSKRGTGESVVVFERDEFTPTNTALSFETVEQEEQQADFKENFNAWWDFLFSSDST